MWTALTVLALCGGVGAFGAVCYRAGRKSAESKALLNEQRENAYVDKIMVRSGTFSRDECLERLRNGKK